MNIPTNLTRMIVLDILDPQEYRAIRHAYTRSRFQRFLRQITGGVQVAGMGLDVSKWQEQADFQIVKGKGLLFGFIRALYGLSVDIRFTQHWANSRGKIKRGAYLYYLDSQDPVAQAQKLYDTCMANGDKGELPPVLDIEGIGNATLTASRIRACAEKLEQLFGIKPIIYTGYYVWRDEVTGNKAWAAPYALWIAAYPLAGWQDDYPTKVLNYPPLIPYPWTAFSLWQWTASAPAAEYGVSGNFLDLDYASPAWAAIHLGTPPPGDDNVIKYADVVYLPPGTSWRELRSKPHSTGSETGIDVDNLYLTDKNLPVFEITTNTEGEWYHLRKGETVGHALGKSAGGTVYLAIKNQPT